MQGSDSTIIGIVTFVCTLSLCLVLISVVSGGVFFFLKRRKKSQPETPVSQAESPSVPSAVVPAQQSAAVQPPMPPQQVAQISPAAPAPVVQQSAPSGFNVSPGELVLLRGEAFSPAAGLVNSYALIGTQYKVNSKTLAETMFAVAILALRESGDVRLEVGKRKGTLGLREVDTLFVVPTGTAAVWPEGSPEACLLDRACETAAKQNNYVHNLIYRSLSRDDSFPWIEILENAKYALCQRGILGMEKGKGLLGGNHITMPPETLAAMQQADVTKIQTLLGRVQQSEPDLWKQLASEIKNGLKARVESDSNSD